MTSGERTLLVNRIAQNVSSDRMQHILRVEALAVDLAHRWNVPEDKARTAALLHDVARDLPESRLKAMARRSSNPLFRAMAATPAPVVLHAPIGAEIAGDDYGVTDPDILRAIALHTTGAPFMDTLSKIIFLADYCEPGRTFDGVLTVRRLLYTDLDRAMGIALKQTIAYLQQHNRPVEHLTIEAAGAFSSQSLRDAQHKRSS